MTIADKIKGLFCSEPDEDEILRQCNVFDSQIKCGMKDEGVYVDGVIQVKVVNNRPIIWAIVEKEKIIIYQLGIWNICGRIKDYYEDYIYNKFIMDSRISDYFYSYKMYTTKFNDIDSRYLELINSYPERIDEIRELCWAHQELEAIEQRFNSSMVR